MNFFPRWCLLLLRLSKLVWCLLLLRFCKLVFNVPGRCRALVCSKLMMEIYGRDCCWLVNFTINITFCLLWIYRPESNILLYLLRVLLVQSTNDLHSWEVICGKYHIANLDEMTNQSIANCGEKCGEIVCDHILFMGV